MATTSLWRVKGWLGKLVVYVENPEKTDNPEYFKSMDDAQRLSDVIEYAVQTKKTTEVTHDENVEIKRQFITGVNCMPDIAREQMIATKTQFGKPGGTIAYHGYQSFAPREATPEIAHEIGVNLAKRLWGNRYQVLVATHLDKDNHLHSHFVINTVSFVNGIKFHRTNSDYAMMRAESDKLCREYGLSVIEDPKQGKSKHYGEWQAEKDGRPTYRSTVKAEIDEAIAQSMNDSQFFANLKHRGYTIKMGKDITVTPPGKERGLKLCRNFGEDYSLDGIRRQIKAHGRPRLPEPKPKPSYKKVKFRGNLKTARKVTGFRALYVHYLYLLGKLPKHRQKSPAQVHFLYREDLRKLDKYIAEMKLLTRNRIDTKEQLFSFKEGLVTEMEQLIQQRTTLYYKLRRLSDEPKRVEVKSEIKQLSEKIGKLRKDVNLCNDIESHSAEMKEKIAKERHENQQKSQRKEINPYEPFRGRR